MIHKVFLILVFQTFYVLALRAQNCIEQTDKISGQKIITSSTEFKGDSSILFAKFSFIKIESDLQISFNIVSQKPLEDNTDLELTVEFADGSSKQLVVDKHIQIVHLPTGNGIQYEAKIDQHAVQKFNQSAVTKIRLSAESFNNYVTLVVPEQEAEQIIQNIKCIK